MGNNTSFNSDNSKRKDSDLSNKVSNVEFCMRWKEFLNKFATDPNYRSQFKWLGKIIGELKSSEKNYSYYFQNEVFKLTKERFFEDDESMILIDKSTDITLKKLQLENTAEQLISENKKPIKMCKHDNCFQQHRDLDSGIHLIENEFLKKNDEFKFDSINHVIQNYVKFNYEKNITLRLEATVLCKVLTILSKHFQKSKFIVNRMIKYFMMDQSNNVLKDLDDLSQSHKRSSCESYFMSSRYMEGLRKQLRRLTEKIKKFADFVAQFQINFYNFDRIYFTTMLSVGGSFQYLKNTQLNKDILSNFVIYHVINDILYSNMLEIINSRYELEQKKLKYNIMKLRNINIESLPVPESFMPNLCFLKKKIQQGYQQDKSKLKDKLKEDCSQVKNQFNHNNSISMTNMTQQNFDNNTPESLKLYNNILTKVPQNTFQKNEMENINNCVEYNESKQNFKRKDSQLSNLSLSIVDGNTQTKNTTVKNDSETLLEKEVYDKKIYERKFEENFELEGEHIESHSTNDTQLEFMEYLYEFENHLPFFKSINILRRIIVEKSPIAKFNVLLLTLKSILDEIKDFHSLVYRETSINYEINLGYLGDLLKFVVLKSNIANWYVQQKFIRTLIIRENANNKLIESLLTLYEGVIKLLSCENIESSYMKFLQQDNQGQDPFTSKETHTGKDNTKSGIFNDDYLFGDNNLLLSENSMYCSLPPKCNQK